MNEQIEALLEGLPADPIDGLALAELRHPEIVAETCEQIREWAGIGRDAAGRATAPEVFALLLGHGREGILRLHESFAQATARTASESLHTFQGLQILARQARALRMIGWDLDARGLKPWSPTQNPRLLCEISPGLDARFRRAAAQRGESLRSFVESALETRLSEIRGSAHRQRPKRKPVATRSKAGAKPAAASETQIPISTAHA